MKRRNPKNVGAILDKTLQVYHLSHKIKEYAAFPFWAEAVGEELAAVTAPEKILRGRVLVVRVIDSVWSQELSLRKDEILERVRQLGIGPVLEDIRFVTGNPKTLRKSAA